MSLGHRQWAGPDAGADKGLPSVRVGCGRAQAGSCETKTGWDAAVASHFRISCPFSDPSIRRGTAVLWAHMWRLHPFFARSRSRVKSLEMCRSQAHASSGAGLGAACGACGACSVFFSRCFAPRGRVDGAADASAQIGTSRGLGWEEPSSHERASAQRGAQLLGSWALSFREFPTIVFLRRRIRMTRSSRR